MITKRIWMYSLILGLLVLSGTLFAQDDGITISFSIPSFIEDQFPDELFADFEAANPGVTVRVVTTDPFQALTEEGDDSTESALDGVRDYVESADIVTVATEAGFVPQLSYESIVAGYFLDMTPLIASDLNLNPTDFYDVLWRSFQVNGGHWALPVSADVIVTHYQPEAFDAAGLFYPDAFWQLPDLQNAVQGLSKYGDDGEITEYGFSDLAGPNYVIQSLLGRGVFDTSSNPGTPDFSSPELEQILNDWKDIPELANIGNITDIDTEAPLMTGQTIITITDDAYAYAPLPGGGAGIVATGFAISAGTQYPELSFALATYLTERPEVANAFFGVTPARQSLRGVETNAGFGFPVPEEIEAFVDDILQSGIPASEMIYSGYINNAITQMLTDNVDARTALDEVELTALDSLEIAQARADEDEVIAVATPPPTTELGAGEVEINFGINSLLPTLQNEEVWNGLVDDFVANDFEVGSVNLDVASSIGDIIDETDMAEDYDCFYMPSNIVQGGDLSVVIPIDPLMASDASVDTFDFVGNSLQLMQSGNQTWGMPLNLQPIALHYNTEIFDNNGVFYPFAGWSVPDFENTLRSLKLDPEDPAPLTSRDFGSDHLLVLIAAYGGVPLDFRTTPVTIDFSSEATVDAVRQVLDLAKEGFIDYQDTADFGGPGGLFGGDETAMYVQSLNALAFFIPQDDDDPYRLIPMPRGEQFSGTAFDIGGAYISANSQVAEACYRFISHIAQSPVLFEYMPTRRSHINSPELEATQGPEAVAFYTEMDALLQGTNVIAIPTIFSDISNADNFVLRFWLNRVFDAYVADESGFDLAAELSDAEDLAEAYLDCSAAIPPLDPTTDIQDYFGEFVDCAVQIDPETEQFFGPLAGN